MNDFSNEQLSTFINPLSSISYLEPRHINDKRIIDPLKLDGGYLDGNAHGRQIHFNNCLFASKVTIGTFRQSGIVQFKDCIFEADVHLNDIGIIIFEGRNEFRKNLDIWAASGHLQLDGLIVDGDLNVKPLNYGNIVLVDINKGQELSAQKLNIVSDCTGLKIKNSSFCNLCFKNIVMKGAINLIEVHLRELSFKNVVLNTTIHLSASQIDEMQIRHITGEARSIKIESETQIENLEVDLAAIQSLLLANSAISSVLFSGINQEANNIDIRRLEFKELRFNEVLNNGIITLRELNAENGTLISFRSSNMGRTDFILCNFAKGQLEFENCKISEVFLSQTDFPKIVVKDGRVNPSQAQLAFGQLATAFQKQGDTVRALEYQSREIEAHHKTLSWRSRTDFFDLVNLTLNKLSNKFGRSWSRGMMFSFLVGLLFFSCTVNATKQFRFDFSVDFHMLPWFLKFMNPLRSVETEKIFSDSNINIKLTPWSYIWDFFGRIFVTYGYYQTIQAFRRFGRK